uniref:Uncharacterized protein n=1 Tax=Oryza brachyantha TaxID=4533 RepID=J3LDH2_ORYBR
SVCRTAAPDRRPRRSIDRVHFAKFLPLRSNRSIPRPACFLIDPVIICFLLPMHAKPIRSIGVLVMDDLIDRRQVLST